MDISKLQRLYGRLKGIRELISIQLTTSKEVGDDYNNIVKDISIVIEEDLSSFMLTGEFFYQTTLQDNKKPSIKRCKGIANGV